MKGRPMNPKNIQIVVGASMFVVGAGISIRKSLKSAKAADLETEAAIDRCRTMLYEHNRNTAALAKAYANVVRRIENGDTTALVDVYNAFENELAFQKIAVRIEM
ncbi:hypothetical protein SEA_AVAZAK_35 [Gordonia phage Avazak]|uniref:Uncharacterized protein n=1 Tax=Gordonia phage Avazak TaxID=2656529 RepID=A0A649V6R9_9CAUD|nr:hypothetical protein HWC78_gp35 [Gordonia phage Avazak]QGJ88017.1 hypothetical protein SEA_AVAZAK_35 [Gordonia phage Avazak]